MYRASRSQHQGCRSVTISDLSSEKFRQVFVHPFFSPFTFFFSGISDRHTLVIISVLVLGT